MSSLIRKSVGPLHAYTPGEQPRGAGVIKLNTNENPYGPSPSVSEWMDGLDANDFCKYPDPLCSDLCEALAKLHRCDAKQIIFGNGSDELLALCTRAFVEPSGLIGFFDPSYSLYPVLSAIENVEVKTFPLSENFEWVEPDAEGVGLFFLTNPNAPTSIQYPKEALRSFCERFRGVVVIDEAYVDFAPYDCMDWANELPNVIVLRTLSKSYGLAFLRAGYAVGHSDLIEALYKIKDSYNVNGFTQGAALQAIQDQSWKNSRCAEIISTREATSKQLKAWGLDVLESAANFLWIKLPDGNAEKLFEELKRKQIYVRYFPAPPTRDYLRVTVGTPAEMEAFLKGVESFIQR